MVQQTNKRVLHTKESIKIAFMQLMLESHLEKITISQITQKASVNRSTFYLHYREVNDIIRELDEEFARDIRKSIEKFDISDLYGSIYGMFSALSASLDENEVKREYVIYSSDAVNIANRLKSIIVEKAMDAITEAYPAVKRREMNYALTFAAAGIVDCYIKWVKDGNNGQNLNALIRNVSLYTEYAVKQVADL